MDRNKKEKLTIWIIIVMIVTLVGSFVLFFLGKYTLSFAVGGVFMIIASFLGQWSSNKNRDYVHRNIHKSNNKW
ncbi:hypothetical protein [Bacillus sp. S/N-304-OC-R1]|uniref:hypothetical protein n=1 Tax=Bacillus sp. S/N-304-OC-R1 TaxID=2758034 RepID=UPI001C8DF358|nr:hypothetical protein [Bacillus sp. S/N-304-OC-R1]MBY0123803.1 hypothetical protein [Bacillus sp. S/N-304-OC-R1]